MKLTSKALILAAAVFLTAGLFNLLAGPALVDLFHTGNNDITIMSDSWIKLNKTHRVLVVG